MSRMKNGSPALSSRFICLKCKKNNLVGAGIQRGKQREKYHVKDLFCINCKERTKNIEVRYKDDENDIFAYGMQIRKNYYKQ